MSAITIVGFDTPAEEVDVTNLVPNRECLVEEATQAMRRRDWDQALLCWQELRFQFPNEIGGWLEAGRVLRGVRRFEEADELLAAAIVRFPQSSEPSILYSYCAQDRGEWDEAARRWAIVRSQFPEVRDAWRNNATVLREAGSREALDELLAAAVQHFPDDVQLAVEYASLPNLRRNWRESLGRLRRLRIQFANTADVLLAEAAILRHHLMGSDEAETLLMEVISRFPDDPRGFIDYAWTADHFGRGPEETLRRWRLAQNRFPEHPSILIGLVIALEANTLFTDADVVRAAAAAKFPDSLDIALDHARAAEKAGDLLNAAVRWEAVASRFPGYPGGFSGAGRALSEAGRFDEAEILVARGMLRFPNDPELFFNYASIAARRGDWQEAELRLIEAERRFPGNPLIATQLAETRLKIALAGSEGGPMPDGVKPAIGMDIERDLLMQFESLGCDCTFGFVQRKYGAEPLSLLRWAGIQANQLIDALKDRFEGVGCEENTEIREADPFGPFAQREYMSRDIRFAILSHTFVPISAHTDLAALRRQVCRRQRFLRDKLVQDLADAEKTFLYKDDGHGTPDEHVQEMYRLLQNYGANTLLYVCEANAKCLPGSATMVAPGLIYGYLDRSALLNYMNAEPAWLALCRRAYALRQAGGSIEA